MHQETFIRINQLLNSSFASHVEITLDCQEYSRIKKSGLSFEQIFFELFSEFNQSSLFIHFLIPYNMHKQNKQKLYVENVAILIQIVIIVALYKVYEKSFTLGYFYLRAVIFLGVNLPFFTKLSNNHQHFVDYVCKTTINMVKFKNKDIGQLLFVTVFLQSTGAAARCFTILVSSTDGISSMSV
ncbi:unnamed protein product [Paramecium octaurelia]|uniref:Transmembrane protein n=1 Tax=Paramecium octaurelia TaxID=43137 RepID=A0A8S1W5J3_PAROT|nr:unnamed protein product [Paramecium octaurelia]